MKLSMVIFLATFGMAATVLADAGVWGMKEYVESVTGATDSLKSSEGSAAYDAITGYSIDRSASGDAARVKVKYTSGSGEALTKSYFCHQHSVSEIDCH